MELLRIERDDVRCTIAPEAGGRVLQLEVRDPAGAWLPLLLAPDDPARVLAEPLAWGCFAMAPWPNRIARGAVRFASHERQLRVNLEGHAIHGVCFDRAWRVDKRDAHRMCMSIAFDERWPFGGRAVQEIALTAGGVTMRVEVHATAAAFPAGAGWHPWFHRDVRPGADVRVEVDADEMYELEAMIPTGAIVPVSGQTDLREGPTLGDRRLDACYRHPRALGIRWGDLTLTLEPSANVRHAVVYTPERGFCVEPQTCAIDAFNLDARRLLDAGVQVVEPGAPLVATLTWRWRFDGAAA